MSAALRSFSAPAFRRLLVCLWQVNSSIAGLTSIALFAKRLVERVTHEWGLWHARTGGLPEYRSEDVEGRREATGRDHLDPGRSSRATGIKPVD